MDRKDLSNISSWLETLDTHCIFTVFSEHIVHMNTFRDHGVNYIVDFYPEQPLSNISSEAFRTVFIVGRVCLGDISLQFEMIRPKNP